MDYFGGHQFQLLVSFVVIVGAAFVALVCDFLKGNNEQLRELALELKFRQDRGENFLVTTVQPAAKPVAMTESVESRKARLEEKAAAEKLAAAQSLEKAIERVAEKQSSPVVSEAAALPKPRRDSRVAREAGEAMERGNAIVAVRPRRAKAAAEAAPAPMAALDIRVQRKAAMRSRLERGKAEQPARDLPVTPREPALEAAAPVPVAEADSVSALPEAPEPKLTVDQKNLLDEILAATVATTPAPHALHREKGRGRSAVRADLFSAIESRVNRLESAHGPSGSLSSVDFSEADFRIAPTPAERLERAIEATQNPSLAPVRSANGSELPAGLQDGFVLSKLVQARNPVSGLVVSIGLGNSDRKTSRIPEPVHNLIRSLLGSEDFGCQSGEDEFLLIFPNERGAAAQRKLNEIAERLWDFQLRSMGAFSILFSWGGVGVNGESISEAVHSASERMHETQRSRKVASVSGRQPVYVSEPAQRVAV